MLHIATTSAGHVSLFEMARSFIAAQRARTAQREAREMFENLKQLDDRTLDDIGVTRAEVYAASELPIEVSAAQELRRMAAERQARMAAERKARLAARQI